MFPGITSNHPVSLAFFQDKLYAAIVNNAKEVILASVPKNKDWKKWNNWTTTNENLFNKDWNTDKPVQLAALEKEGKSVLALTFTGLDRGIYIGTSSDGSTWTAPALQFNKRKRTKHPISIAAFKGLLYIAYVGEDKNIYLSSSTDGLAWSNPRLVQPPGVRPTEAPVNLSVFKNRLVLAWNLGGVVYTINTADGIHWDNTGTGLVGNKGYPVGMSPYDGLLYAFYNRENIVATISKDGKFWPDKGNKRVLVKTPWKSDHQITSLPLENGLLLGFVNRDDAGIYLASSSSATQPSLPNVQHNSLVVDPQNHSTLFAGSDVGIYYSTDAGQSWMPYSNGLPGVPVNYMKIFPPAGPNGQVASNMPDRRRFLRAATYGRGMFERSLDNSFNNSGVNLYIRKNQLDRGFYNVPQGKEVSNSPDVKVSYPNSKNEYPFPIDANFLPI